MPNWIYFAVAGAALLFVTIWIRRGGSAPKEVIVKSLKSGARVIDVRSPEEYASGHFRGAVNIPVQEIARRSNEIGSKEHPLVLYCASGMRSASAVAILKNLGFADVVNAGGLANMPAS